MVMAAMLIDALHAALEDREEPFDGVGMYVGALLGNVLLLGVIYSPMKAKAQAQCVIIGGLVGHHAGFAGDILAENGNKGLGLEIVHDHAAAAASGAIHQGHDLALLSRAALGLGLLFVDANI